MMKLSAVSVLAVVGALPLAHAVILVGTGTSAATTTLGITLGTGTTTAATAAAATAVGVGAVAAALVVGGLAVAAAANRNKRSTSSLCMPVNNPEAFLTLAANSDQLGCGLRLVCELEASKDQALTQEEMLILSLFGRRVKPVTFSEMRSAKSGFQYAALVGSQAKHAGECAQVFDQCPFNRTTIMAAFNTTKQ